MHNSFTGISIRLTERDLIAAKKAAEKLGVSTSAFAIAAIESNLDNDLSALVPDLEMGQSRLSSQISAAAKLKMATAAKTLGIRTNQWAVLAIRANSEGTLHLTPSSHGLHGLDAFYDKEALRANQLTYRRGQHGLSRAIYEHLVDGKIGLCEAGTGTGKAYACLTAAEAFATAKKMPVVVATFTRALQKQLFETSKMMGRVIGHAVNVAVVYGKQNYVSPVRLEEMISDTDTDAKTRKVLKKWKSDTDTWLIADLAEFLDDDFPIELLEIEPQSSDEVELLPYREALKKAADADVIITSHHMLIYAMMQKNANIFGFIPDHIVIDEAHLFEAAADTVLGKQVSLASVSWGLKKLMAIEGRHKKGLVEWSQSLDAFTQNIIQQGQGKDVLELVSRNGVSEAIKSSESWVKHLSSAPKIAKTIKLNKTESKAYKAIIEASRLFADLKKSSGEAQQYNNIYATLSPVLNYVRLLSTSSTFIAKDIEHIVWNKIRGASLLSATLFLPTKNNGESAQFFINSVGLKDKNVVVEPAFFEAWIYDNLTVYAASEDFPTPKSSEIGTSVEREAWLEAVASTITQIDAHPYSDENGGIMVLCTSYDDAKAIETRLSNTNRQVIAYHRGDDMRTTLNNYKALEGKGILIGLGGFWTGVDLPGCLLTDLVITRLPLISASDKLVISRFEYIKKTMGVGVAFATTILPKMAMTLKQGMGRVIRSETDIGRVYITDPRILTKPKWRISSILRKYEPIIEMYEKTKPMKTCKSCGQTGHAGTYPFFTVQHGSLCDDCV